MPRSLVGGGGGSVPGMRGNVVVEVQPGGWEEADLPWDSRRGPCYLAGLSWLKIETPGGWAERILGILGIAQPDGLAVKMSKRLSTRAELVLNVRARRRYRHAQSQGLVVLQEAALYSNGKATLGVCEWYRSRTYSTGGEGGAPRWFGTQVGCVGWWWKKSCGSVQMFQLLQAV